MNKKRALIIEDEESQALLAKYAFELVKGMEFQVDIEKDGISGLGKALSNEYDIAIIDRQLPRLEGLEVVKEIRKFRRTTPILILTCMGRKEDEIEGYELAIDEYLAKPCDPEVLAGHIRAIVRRYERSLESAIIKVRDVEIDMLNHNVKRNGVEVPLPHKQFNLLEFLARNKGSVITFDDIRQCVYSGDKATNHAISSCKSKLCENLKQGGNPFDIRNVWGVGYEIED